MPAQVRMYLSRQGGEAPRLELSREGIALTPAQRRVVADVLRAANSVNGLWVCFVQDLQHVSLPL